MKSIIIGSYTAVLLISATALSLTICFPLLEVPALFYTAETTVAVIATWFFCRSLDRAEGTRMHLLQRLVIQGFFALSVIIGKGIEFSYVGSLTGTELSESEALEVLLKDVQEGVFTAVVLVILATGYLILVEKILRFKQVITPGMSEQQVLDIVYKRVVG